MKEVRFQHVSRPRQALIRLCQRVNYGAILNLTVRGGEVLLASSPDVSLDIRLDGDVGPRAELHLTDFALPIESLRLLSQLDALRDGIIEKIIVHDGTPRRVVLRGLAAERQS